MKTEKNTLQKQLFQDVPKEEREAMLDANCVRPEEKDVKKYFELEEITDMRKQYLDNSILIRKATEKLNAAKEIFKQEVAEPLTANNYLINSIRTGFVEVKQQVYLFDSQDDGMMGYYDSSGDLIESRRLMPEERQTRIK